ncbi:MAG: YihY/virulence factor BrkB family protein [Ferruginibacter sp.]
MKLQDNKKATELSILFQSIRPSFSLLSKNNPLRLAGATAFFTTFAMPPIVFILAQLFGLFLSPKKVGGGLIENISNNLGKDGAEQVRDVIKSIRGFNNDWWVILLGSFFLLFVATTLFMVIKNSLDDIWQIKTVKHPGIKFSLFGRLRSFAIILLIGLLFFANLFFKSVEIIGVGYVDNFFHNGSIWLKIIFSEVSSVVIVAAWFIILFRFLADGRPVWKAAFAGGLLTALLFTAGRVLLRTLLVNSNIGLLYGTSGSFVLVLLFVFYTSFMLYFGACFIAVYSEKKGWAIGYGNGIPAKKAEPAANT